VASNELHIPPQGELALAREAPHGAVSHELVWRQKTAAAAFSLACSASGLDDKEIYLSLDIDPGHFSRIKKGEAGFPPDKLAHFCEVVGNTVYPEWIAYQVGCTLMLVKSEAERRAEAAEARAVEAERKLAYATELLRGRAAA
jgi:hypothetical protein